MPGAVKSMVGVVISAGKMQRAVKIRVAGQVNNSFLKKQFGNHKNYLVSDPNSSIRLGDVIRVENEGRQLSRHIRHVVSEIVAPWGPAIDERPPVLSAVERHAIWKSKYDAKIERRREERRTAQPDQSEQPNRPNIESVHVEKGEQREGSREARRPRGTKEPRVAKRAKRESYNDTTEGMVKRKRAAT